MIAAAPATPPGMRVRTGRFESLRSGQSWHSQLVKVRNGQHALDRAVTVAPPPMAVPRHLFGHIFRCPQCLEFPVDRVASVKVVEFPGRNSGLVDSF